MSAATDMYQMFFYAKEFNQPLGDWDVSNVTDMYGMFHSATAFNQDLSKWCVSNILSTIGDAEFSSGSALTYFNLPTFYYYPYPFYQMLC